MLKLLKENGVIGLSEGMNSRMVPVNVPSAFNWMSLDGSISMPTIWHWGGYGQPGENGNPIRLPNTGHALAYEWRGDNLGPPETAQEVFDNAHRELTNFVLNPTNASDDTITVVSSSLDEYFHAILTDGVFQHLPVVKEDLSDSWIWGVASDPIKTQRMRVMNKVSDCLRVSLFLFLRVRLNFYIINRIVSRRHAQNAKKSRPKIHSSAQIRTPSLPILAD